MDRKRRRTSRHPHAPRRCCGRTMKSNSGRSSKAVARKMEALRELIPSAAATSGGEMKLRKATGTSSSVSTAERLFGETAEYILALRAQVEVLKRLVDIYSAPVDDDST